MLAALCYYWMLKSVDDVMSAPSGHIAISMMLNIDERALLLIALCCDHLILMLVTKNMLPLWLMPLWLTCYHPAFVV